MFLSTAIDIVGISAGALMFYEATTMSKNVSLAVVATVIFCGCVANIWSRFRK